MNWQTILNSDAFWVALGFALNSLATILVVKIPPAGPVRKAIRALHGLLDKIDPPAPGPAVALLFAVGLALIQQGCSLETARQARINSQLQAEKSGRLMAPTRPEAECKRLDDVHVYTLYGAEVSLGVGVTAGSVAAATSGDTQKIATSVGIGTAAVAAGLAYWSNSAAARWAERCQ